MQYRILTTSKLLLIWWMNYMYKVPLEYWEPHDYICCIVKQNNQSCISTAKLEDNTREKLQRSIIRDKSLYSYKKQKKKTTFLTTYWLKPMIHMYIHSHIPWYLCLQIKHFLWHIPKSETNQKYMQNKIKHKKQKFNNTKSLFHCYFPKTT